MKKHFFSLSLILGLVFGMACFTSCSDDKDANEQASENRIEFLEHCRANLKDLAENMNFTSWNAANTLNQCFNQYVLNNPDFEKAVLNAFMQKVMTSVKPVEAGSELAAMGYQTYGTVDLTDFNYRFTMNANNDGFDVEAADDFEVILNAWNPTTQQVEAGLYRLTLKSGGSTTYKFEHAMSQQPGMALVVLIPSEFQFSIADRLSGQWHDGFSGSFKNQVSVADGHEYAQLDRDTWTVAGTITSDFAGVTALGAKADQTTLDFSVVSDKVNNKGDVALSWSQNGRKMIDMTLKESGDGSGGIYNVDLSQLSSGSIFDVIASVFSGRSLDECKLTILDDLTTTFSISDMQKATKLSQGVARARRNYADEATIDQFTQQFNEIMKFQITCKGINQTYPMKLITTKFGVDWWTMPAFRFAEGSDYVLVTDALDQESIRYMINIADHAAEPMQQSAIVVRQLMQFIQTLVGGLQNQQNQQNQQGS